MMDLGILNCGLSHFFLIIFGICDVRIAESTRWKLVPTILSVCHSRIFLRSSAYFQISMKLHFQSTPFYGHSRSLIWGKKYQFWTDNSKGRAKQEKYEHIKWLLFFQSRGGIGGWDESYVLCICNFIN